MTANRSTAFSVVTSASFATEFVHVPGIYRKNKGKHKDRLSSWDMLAPANYLINAETLLIQTLFGGQTHNSMLFVCNMLETMKEWLETRQRVPTLSDQCVFKITIPVILLSAFTISTFTINSE